jgi:phage-related minor tail protein
MAKAEIASAYVSLIPTFKGGRKAIEDEFEGPAEEGGKKSGEAFGNGFGGAFKGMLAAGAILGGATLLAGAFSLAMEQADLPGIMKSQFGLTEEAASASAETAANVYANGWGASIGEVGLAVGEVERQLSQLGKGGDVEALTTNAQALADVFGQDVSSVITSAGQLVKTGLVPDMQSAFDLMAVGFQNGLDSGGDLLDTLTEYSVQFQTLGLDATTALGLVNQGLSAGARNSDLVADAIKEFAIRSIDGTEGVAAGFEALGLSSEEMVATFAAGGPEAAAAFDTVLDRLREMEDPVARDAAAVALFGTQAEDLNEALYALDPSEAAAGLGEVSGAAQEVSDTVGGGLQAQLDTLSRSFNDDLAGALSFLMPLFQVLLTILKPLLPLLIPLAIAIGVLVVVQWAWNAALAASPITWIILGIVALIAIIILLVVHWDTVVAAIGIAWDWLKEKAGVVWGAIADFFVMIGTKIADFFIGIWEGIKSFFVGIWNAIVAYVQQKIAEFLLVMEFLGSLPGKVSAWFQGLYNAAKDKLNALVNWVKDIPDKIMSALGNLKDLLFNAGKDILEGLLEGIESMWNSVQSKFSDLTSSIPDWKGPEDTDKRLLRPAGRWIIGSLEDGMDDEIPNIESKLTGLTSDIGMSMTPHRSVHGGSTAALADEDRTLLRDLAQARNRVDVRLGANLTSATQREYAMDVS